MKFDDKRFHKRCESHIRLALRENKRCGLCKQARAEVWNGEMDEDVCAPCDRRITSILRTVRLVLGKPQ